MKTRLLLIALITAIAGMGTSLAACSSDDDDSGNNGGQDAGNKDTGPGNNDSGGNGAATFTQVYDQVINQRCKGCHGPQSDGTPPRGGLLLVPKETAHQNLVNQVSPGGPCKTGDAGTAGIKLVEPGSPENSLLYDKVHSTPKPKCGGRMPLPPQGGTFNPLTDDQMDLIESWIEDGAKNN